MAWDPTQASGLVAWYDANQITGVADAANMTTWTAAFGGSTYNLAGNGTYYKTTTAKLINSLPAVWVNAQGYSKAGTLTSQPYTVVWIGGVAAINTFYYLSDDTASNTGGALAVFSTSNQFAYQAGIWQQGGQALDTLQHLVIGVFNYAAVSALYVDQAWVSSGNPGNRTENFGRLGTSASGSPLNGFICEWALYSAALTATDIANWQAYAKTKWATPSPPAVVVGSICAAASSATVVVTPVSGTILAGNLLVAMVYTSVTTTVTITAPTGFTLAGQLQTATGGNAAVFTKVATGSEPTSYSFVAANPVSVALWQMQAAAGLDGVTFNSSTSSTTAFATASQTPTQVGDVQIVAYGTTGGVQTSNTKPTAFAAAMPYASVVSNAITPYQGAPIPNTSPTGAITLTSPASSNYIGISALVKAVLTFSSGTATLPLGPLTLTSSGTAATPTITGAAAIPLGPVTLTSTSRVTGVAPATLNLGPLTLTTLATLTFLTTVPLGPLALTSTSAQFAVPTIPLGPLTLIATSLSGGGGTLARVIDPP
jgi:hypothetical protein